MMKRSDFEIMAPVGSYRDVTRPYRESRSVYFDIEAEYAARSSETHDRRFTRIVRIVTSITQKEVI